MKLPGIIQTSTFIIKKLKNCIYYCIYSETVIELKNSDTEVNLKQLLK